MRKVLVVDDSPVLTRGLVATVETAAGLEVVGTASHIAEAVAACERLRPDVATLDLHLRGGRREGRQDAWQESWQQHWQGGPALDAVRHFQALRCAVVVMSGRTPLSDLRGVYDTGAAACLCEDASEADLVAALEAARPGQRLALPGLPGEPYRAGHRAECHPEHHPEYYPEHRAEHRAERRPALSKRELAVLALAAEGTPNKAIAHRLGVSVSTVKIHLSNARQKLRAKDRAHAVLQAYRFGVLPVQPARLPRRRTALNVA